MGLTKKAYGEEMMEAAAETATVATAETILRDELALGGAIAEAVVPVLRHLLVDGARSVFNDEVVARVKGVARDLARQLLDGVRRAAPASGRERAEERAIALAETLLAHPATVLHLHALALEWQLAERLQAKLAIDPVLAPLLQALIASPDSSTSMLAMQGLAAQARFCRQMRRMQLSLHELPAPLLDAALAGMRGFAAADPSLAGPVDAAEAHIRETYDEGKGRLGIIARLVQSTGGAAVSALAVTEAGTSIFLSALAARSGQDRDAIALSTSEPMRARLALSLRASGLDDAAVKAQLFALHSDLSLPEGFDGLSAERAAALLARGLPGGQ